MAQEESISISKNMRWSYLNRMKNGDFITCKAPYGFRLNKKELEVHEEEAQVVRWIFDSYINGMGKRDIADDLTRRKIPKRNGDTNWSYHMVRYILKNEKYMGDVLLQKRFTTDVLPFKVLNNNGQKDKYYITESNIPIITREVFEKAQAISDSRYNPPSSKTFPGSYPLSKKIICSACGKKFRRKVIRDKTYWVCRGHNTNSETCYVKQIREQEIYSAFIRMYNILKSNSRIILSPLLNKLQELRDKALKNNNVADVEKQILDLSEQTLVLNRLRSKELLDPAVFMSQINKIEKDISDLRQKKHQLLELFDRDQDIITTQMLIDIIENGTPQITQFDESLFNDLVDHIKVGEKDEVIFHLINGLELTEKIERKVI
jgi:NTP pyrophosphatase (non-canonical NTP hydrolase)